MFKSVPKLAITTNTVEKYMMNKLCLIFWLLFSLTFGYGVWRYLVKTKRVKYLSDVAFKT